MARLVETELLLMIMQGMNLYASEVVFGSDKVNADVCSKWAAIPVYCDYPFPKPETTKVRIKYWAIQLDVYVTTAMLNESDPSPLTMRFLTSI